MGFYVLNAPEHEPFGKRKTLLDRGGLDVDELVKIDKVDYESVLRAGLALWPNRPVLICIVYNEQFEAANVITDEQRFEYVKPNSMDDRPRSWVLLPDWLAKELGVKSEWFGDDMLQGHRP